MCSWRSTPSVVALNEPNGGRKRIGRGFVHLVQEPGLADDLRLLARRAHAREHRVGHRVVADHEAAVGLGAQADPSGARLRRAAEHEERRRRVVAAQDRHDPRGVRARAVVEGQGDVLDLVAALGDRGQVPEHALDRGPLRGRDRLLSLRPALARTPVRRRGADDERDAGDEEDDPPLLVATTTTTTTTTSASTTSSAPNRRRRTCWRRCSTARRRASRRSLCSSSSIGGRGYPPLSYPLCRWPQHRPNRPAHHAAPRRRPHSRRRRSRPASASAAAGSLFALVAARAQLLRSARARRSRRRASASRTARSSSTQVDAGHVKEITSKGTAIQGTFTRRPELRGLEADDALQDRDPGVRRHRRAVAAAAAEDASSSTRSRSTRGAPWWQNLLARLRADDPLRRPALLADAPRRATCRTCSARSAAPARGATSRRATASRSPTSPASTRRRRS